VWSYLITTPKGHVLLDGGLAETALIEKNVVALGFRTEDVKKQPVSAAAQAGTGEAVKQFEL
jgi:hypothetical protein